MSDLSHINKDDQPEMVDVSAKDKTVRSATARSRINVGREIMKKLNDDDFITAKGSLIHTTIIAAQMAAKKTSDLIPLCHPIAMTACTIKVEVIDDQRIEVLCTVKTKDRTGVEMEALTGASVGTLTIYDMVKALSHDICIEETRLLKKTGGKSDYAYQTS
ncbi:MAG: cyclic pyranopterin monophosphate synthase MoaC [Saprospiraceae bacterium]|nr:cyclic pyranopterin monophosphate synthase MoaC [Saprospiraceae bacterium]